MLTDEQIATARAYSVLDLASTNTTLRGKRRHFNGPCPRCGGSDRFWVDAARNSFGCRGCGDVAHGGYLGSGGIDLVMFVEGIAFGAAVEKLIGLPPATRRATGDDDGMQRHVAMLWQSRMPAAGSIVETYLRSRGITVLSPNIGFLPGFRDRPPAMIAPFGMPGRPPDAVHLTYLRPDGSGKADVEKPKRVLGSVEGPIALSPPTDALAMAITEGIEDGLTVYQATSLCVWAAGSRSYMTALADLVPDYIETVTICAHNDDGRRNAIALAKALRGRGLEVLIEGLA